MPFLERTAIQEWCHLNEFMKSMVYQAVGDTLGGLHRNNLLPWACQESPLSWWGFPFDQHELP